ncbi:MAG: GGDEF domain-containing protein [Syntrophobacteraceae bacterium]|jgi:diguanylate cyclase (GGDEF)-like protein|nr:GGDEF domain-containing protein [Syntrophobacteraceae bacterium]
MSIQGPAQEVERLSLIMIDVLKALSAARQPLTPASLQKAFSEKSALLELLTPSPSPRWTHQREKAPSAPGLVQIESLRTELQDKQEAEKRLLRQAASLDAEIARTRYFYKRAMLTLLALTGDPKNQHLMSEIEELRQLVSAEADVENQFQCLQRLKDRVLKEAPREDLANGQKLDPGAQWFQTGSLDVVSGENRREQPYAILVKNAFLKIMNQFELVSEQSDPERYVDLRRRLTECQDLDAVIAVGEEIVGLVRSYMGRVVREQDQVTSFAREVGKNLLDVEKHLMSYLKGAEDGQQANAEFHEALGGQMEGIRESFVIGQSIDEIKGFVFAKLAVIRNVIENKARDDEARYQKACTEIEDLQKNIRTMKKEIGQAKERTRSLEREVLLDSLTGIHNRRAYEQHIMEEMQRFRRYQQTFSLILFDVDRFKDLNDRFGHRAGDKCLKEIINRIKLCIRNTDFLSRYGGEEFAIILPGTNREGACIVAEKVRRAIEMTRFYFQNQAIPVTISLGVTEVREADPEPETVFARADDAMYRAKREGRNRVCAL